MCTGVWLLGARGSVAVTSMVGALALRAGLAEPLGCVTDLPPLRSPALPGFDEMVFCGHDPATIPLTKKAESLAAAGVLPARLVSSTEPAVAVAAAMPPSSRYAYAAFTAGCSYVDFTPSSGARFPGLGELAAERGLPYAGHDGKTGETLLKAMLAPMFAMRHLQGRSWSGINLLGGGDGANLCAFGFGLGHAGT